MTLRKRASKLSTLICGLLPIVFVLGLSGAEASRGAERVAYLRERLLVLEGGAIESGDTEGSGSEVATPPADGDTAEAAVPLATGWQNPQAWERLEPGMAEATVREILGEPRKILSTFQDRVERVFYFEKAIHRWSGQLRGQVGFRGGVIAYIDKPDF